MSEIILRDFTSEVYPPNEVEQYLERVENVMTAFDILNDEYINAELIQYIDSYIHYGNLYKGVTYF